MADALEADWNQRLRQLQDLHLEHERRQHDDEAQLDEPARKRVVELAQDFPGSLEGRVNQRLGT